MVESLVDLKTKVYDSFVKVRNIENDLVPIDSDILRKPLQINLEECRLYDSLIVKMSRSLVD